MEQAAALDWNDEAAEAASEVTPLNADPQDAPVDVPAYVAADDVAESDMEDEVADTVGAAFDRDFYLRAHPDLVARHIDPPRHYLAYGWQLGWDPTPEFSTRFYLERSADVRASGINPFFHYLKWGQHEGRAPSAHGVAQGDAVASAAAARIARDFDPAFYRAAYPEHAENHVDPLLHYLHFGWRMGRDPSARFSTRFYLDSSPDVAASDENPLHHYVRTGRAEGRLPQRPAGMPAGAAADLLEGDYVRAMIAPVFDARFYRESYPDIAAGGLDPLLHYLSAGWREGRDPAPWFSTRYYLDRYPGVATTRMNPLLHYVVWGRGQGFQTFRSDRGDTPARQVPGAELVRERDIRAMLAPPAAFADAAPVPPKNPNSLDIHWVIPDFEAGGGGHMTIFRMVRWLELFGHRCAIWVLWPAFDRTDAEREEIMLRSYRVVHARIRSLPATPQFSGADALIATSWDSAYFVRSATGARAKFYFVQDYEPFFYPVGTRSLAARETYGFGLTCICASPWLEGLMRAHGCTAASFRLAADERYVRPAARPDNAVPRIAFYAREHTTRRAVELGLLALEILAARGERFHVDLFGTETRHAEASFALTNWGVAEPDVLARLYGEADLGVCFSATNYSLVPQEMMACGLPVVELDGESTRAAFPDGVAALARPDPYAIADAITVLLRDRAARDALAERGSEWVASLSWDAAARAVEAALLDQLCGGKPRLPPRRKAVRAPKVSVVIPTCNGGELFAGVLASVLRQRAPWDIEVIAIDSESADGTWEHLREQRDRVRAVRIAKSEFQHGRTRNLAAGMARGDYIAFLTQDAQPADEFWLYNLVVMLERFPRAAGAFGRHVAWPDASPFTQRDIAQHFALFDRMPLAVSKYLDLGRYRARAVELRRFLHFYSDNNSCLRRSVWERHPYPEVDFGEDQLWAEQVIRAGYQKVYAPQATVFHSHDYDEQKTFERARTEAQFFRIHFGYDLIPRDLRNEICRINADDESWGARNGVSADAIAQRKRLNVHKLIGFAAGATEGMDYASTF